MPKVIAFVKRYPYACLLIVQLLSIIFYGLVSDSKLSRFICSCFGLAVPILALLVVYRSPAITWIATILAVPSILLCLTTGFAEMDGLLLWGQALQSIIYFYMVIRHVYCYRGFKISHIGS